MMLLDDYGYFWWNNEPVPDGHFAPSSTVSARLTIDEEGRIALDLNGFLPNPRGPLASIFHDDSLELRERRIQGFLKTTGNGNTVLLLGLIRSGGRASSHQISYERYVATTCLVGVGRFPATSAPLKFSRLEIDLKGLEDWLRVASIEIRRSRSLSAKY